MSDIKVGMRVKDMTGREGVVTAVGRLYAEVLGDEVRCYVANTLTPLESAATAAEADAAKNDEDGYTINVKVNGLEDVERLRKAIEGVNVANALKDASTQASAAWAKALTDAMSDSVLACHAAVIQEAIEAACADLNDKPAGPRFTIGDVVSLKSGGPRMTVSRIETYPGCPDKCALIGCVWFTRVNDDVHATTRYPYEATRYTGYSGDADFPADCLEY